jgi:hypothetical protein
MATQPANSEIAAQTGNNAASWGMLALVLCLAILLAIRLKSKDEG